MATKRPRGPPTGQTPKKPPKIPKNPSGKRNRKLVFDHEASDISKNEGASSQATTYESDFQMDICQTSDNSQQINVLSTHEVVKYVIPSFSILNVKLRHAIVTFGSSSEQIDVFFNESTCQVVSDSFPFSIQVEKMCTVEVRQLLA